jgi:penicillin-binding protein 2
MKGTVGDVPGATASWVAIRDIQIAGKTGTAQNPHGPDHSIFVAFAPADKPKIAIAVYVENAGFGSTFAAPVASVIIEKYLKREVENKYLEDFVLNQNIMSQ